MQIRNHLGCTAHPAVDALKELEQAGLIRKEYQKRGLPLKIYVNDIRTGDSSTHYTASEKPQDKAFKKPYPSSFNKQKTHTAHSPKEEKQVSFDVEKADEIAREELCHFSEKRKKRRTRNIGPTI